jgi:hypothetical protein
MKIENLTNRFTGANFSRSRGMYRYTTSEQDPYFIEILGEALRDIMVSNLVDKLF